MIEKILLLLASILLLIYVFIRNKKRKSEYAKVIEDAALYGFGYLQISPDGKYKRIDPKDIFLSPKEQK